MKLTLLDPNEGKTSVIDVSPDDPIENIKALAEIDIGIPFAQQTLVHNNRELMIVPGKAISSFGIKPDDLVMVYKKVIPDPNLISQILGGLAQPYDPLKDPALIKEAQNIKAYYESKPDQLNSILHRDPELASAVLSEDMTDLIKIIYNDKKVKRERQMQELKRIQALNADPLNPENQKMIEEEIRKKNIEENLEYAQEFIPEVFAPVTMLYIDITINKHAIQAFVDSGAQNTIMSKGCAERCGILRLVDTRYAGTAIGVGTAKIMGRIHAIDIFIGKHVISCSLTILEDDKVEFLFGLDNLKRHECCIDLKRHVLAFNDNQFSVPFLSEKEIKRTLQQGYQEMESGSKISQSSEIKDHGFSDDMIKRLMNFGFERPKVIKALQLSNGNEELAASILFTNSSMLR